MASTGRRIKAICELHGSVPWPAGFCAGTDGDGRAVIQLELTGGYHLLTGAQALAHQHQAAASFAGLDKASLGDQQRLAIGVLSSSPLSFFFSATAYTELP